MGQRADADSTRAAEIDAALKSLFDALAGRPAPASFNALIDQLDRQAPGPDVRVGDHPPPGLRPPHGQRAQ